MTLAPRFAGLLEDLGQTLQVSDATEGGEGVFLRHDIDDDLDIALEAAWLEASKGQRATYFALPGASYWESAQTFDKLLQIQDFGHEVGLHLNVVADWMAGRVDDVPQALGDTLDGMRDAGIRVVGTAGHGDALCYTHGFANQWIWTELFERYSDGLPRNAEGLPAEDAQHELVSAG